MSIRLGPEHGFAARCACTLLAGMIAAGAARGRANPTRRAGQFAGLAMLLLASGALARAQSPGWPSPDPPGRAQGLIATSPAGMPAASLADMVGSVEPPEPMPGPATV